MPIYEYVVKEGYDGCQKCKEPFEYLQRSSDPVLKECPECHSPLEKIISRSTFRLIGSGWAKDGYSHTEKAEK